MDIEALLAEPLSSKTKEMLRTAGQLGIGISTMAEQLRHLRDLYAMLPPEARCPCLYGADLWNVKDHYHACPEIPMAKRKEEIETLENQLHQ